MLVAAGLGTASEHALISLLALNGLRVSEATGANIEALGVERGHRTLVVTRKGGKVVTVPLAPRTARAIDLAIRRTGAPLARSRCASGGHPYRVSTRCTVAGFRPSRNAIRAGPSRRATRSPTIRRSVRTGVRAGLACGREDRPAIPAAPCCRYRAAQRAAVVWETWNRSAARRTGQPSSTTHRASRSCPVSVSGALRWGMRTSRWLGVDVVIHTEPGRSS
jgi:integrase